MSYGTCLRWAAILLLGSRGVTDVDSGSQIVCTKLKLEHEPHSGSGSSRKQAVQRTVMRSRCFCLSFLASSFS